MPSMELISAMPWPALPGGMIVPMRLIPSGIAAMDRPTMDRPTIMTAMLSVSAQTREPAISVIMAITSMRFLPYRSPRRPKTGTATAATSRVEVSTHSIAADDACRLTAIRGRSGTRIEEVSAATRAASAISPRATDCRAAPPGRAPLSWTARPCTVSATGSSSQAGGGKTTVLYVERRVHIKGPLP